MFSSPAIMMGNCASIQTKGSECGWMLIAILIAQMAT